MKFKELIGIGIFAVIFISITQDFALALWFILLLSIWAIKSNQIEISFDNLFIFLFFYLFVFRYLFLIYFNVQPTLGRVQIDVLDLRKMFFLGIQASVVFLLTIKIIKFQNYPELHRASLSHFFKTSSSRILGNLLFGFSILGFLLLLISVHNLSELATMLFSHRKGLIGEGKNWQLGMTLWSLFVTPYLSLELTRIAFAKFHGQKMGFPIKLISVLILVILFFGGRLIILIAGAMVYVFARYLKIGIGKSWIFLSLITVVIFLFIGGARVGSNVGAYSSETLVSATTYPVLDAATLVAYTDSDIPQKLQNKTRYIAYFNSLVPRFLWPDKPTLTRFTLDTQIASTFGNENQRGITGWPSGFVSEPFLLNGPVGVLAYSSIFAFTLAFLNSRVNSKRLFRLPGQEFVMIFTLAYLVIALVKDGDTLSSVQGAVRLYIWLEVLLIATFIYGKISMKYDQRISK